MAAQLPARLNILAAVFGPLDVTQQVQDGVAKDQTYTTNSLSGPVGVADPWYGVLKTFVVLYQYGDNEPNIFITQDSSGVQKITPTTPARSPFMNPNGKTFGDRTNALAIVWGAMDNNPGPVSPAVYDNLYTNGSIQCSNTAFGFDGLPNWQKTAIVFYRYGTHGRPYAVFAKEGSTLYLSK